MLPWSRAASLFPTILAIGTAVGQQDTSRVRLEPVSIPSQASIRGCSAVDERLAWLSGSGGTVLRTSDGGTTWEQISIPGGDELDFRDIEAFDAARVFVMSAGTGDASRIYRTLDGGGTWELLYRGDSGEIFLDGMAFWSPQRGVAFGDPVKGRLFLLRTEDGRQWTPLEGTPRLAEGEHGFAASGTSIAVWAPDRIWVGTGGSRARVYRSRDGGNHWQIAELPMTQGRPSAGIFSLAFFDENNGVALGGDYQQPDRIGEHLAITTDGGENWTAAVGWLPYRSAAVFLERGELLLASGVTGVDVSGDGGRDWTNLSETGYHTLCVDPSGKFGWAAGADGRAARVIVE